MSENVAQDVQSGADDGAGAEVAHEDAGGWQDLNTLLDGAGEGGVSDDAAVGGEAAPPNEDAQQEQQPAPEQHAQQEHQAQPQPATEPQQQMPQPEQQVVPQTPDEAVALVEQQLAEHFNESVAALQQQYEQQLSQMVAPEEVQAMEEALASGDAASTMAVMQSILARGLSMAHLNGLRASLHYIRELAPRYAQTTVAVNAAAQTAEQKFREAFPNVDINTYGQEIVALAQAFRQQNPNMSLDEMIQAVGQTIVARHGLAQQQAQAQTGAGARPADRVFIPADGAAASAQNQPPSPDEEYSKALEMAMSGQI